MDDANVIGLYEKVVSSFLSDPEHVFGARPDCLFEVPSCVEFPNSGSGVVGYAGGFGPFGVVGGGLVTEH